MKLVDCLGLPVLAKGLPVLTVLGIWKSLSGGRIHPCPKTKHRSAAEGSIKSFWEDLLEALEQLLQALGGFAGVRVRVFRISVLGCRRQDLDLQGFGVSEFRSLG